MTESSKLTRLSKTRRLYIQVHLINAVTVCAVKRGWSTAGVKPARELVRSSQRHEAGNGPSYAGAQNCHDRVDRMEEGSVLRRPISETTNSLSVSDRVRSILGIFSGGGRRVLETLGFERSLSRLVRRCVPRAPSLTTTLGPLG
jgi:hypothetical protein